jgi:hypothetical protein
MTERLSEVTTDGTLNEMECPPSITLAYSMWTKNISLNKCAPQENATGLSDGLQKLSNVLS